MRTVRLTSLLVAAAILTTACEKTADSPGKGDTAVPYGGSGANGSVGSTPGYLNAAGVDKNPNTGKPAAATPRPTSPADSAAKPAAAPADTAKKAAAKK